MGGCYENRNGTGEGFGGYIGELRRSGLAALALESKAKDRGTYLRRPDLGRALSADSAALLTPVRSRPMRAGV